MRAGKRSKRKGKEFERSISRDLREVYDPPELCRRIAKATNADRKKHLSESCVRRGKQGRNAHEPDIVAPCEWWFELEDGGSKGPIKKLGQARNDLELHQRRGGNTWKRAVSICHAKAAKSITATLTLLDLWAAVRGEPFTACGADLALFHDLPVTIDYQEFLSLLRCEYERSVIEPPA